MTDYKITILYVDDEPINLMLFEKVFEKEYNIITAKSGIEALKLLKTNSNIQVVITDMRMPNMNGLEFVSQAKTEYPNLHYFLLTGYDITDDIRIAIENGIINNSFSKPFKVNIITNAINEVVV
ncbi:MAG: response regulator [Marinilabiliaceae bacterium]|nr:response regulator [Marinilabiliaceae bacterium]